MSEEIYSFECPFCSTSLSVPLSFVGRTGVCQSCQSEISAPPLPAGKRYVTDAFSQNSGGINEPAPGLYSISDDSEQAPPAFNHCPPPLDPIPLEDVTQGVPFMSESFSVGETSNGGGFQKSFEEFATISKTGASKLSKLARPAGRSVLFFLRFPIPLKQDHLISNAIKIPFNLGCSFTLICIIIYLLFVEVVAPFILIPAILIVVIKLCIKGIQKNKDDPWLVVRGRNKRIYKVRISRIADVQISNNQERRPEFVRTDDNQVFKLDQARLREDVQKCLIDRVSNQSDLESLYADSGNNAGVGTLLLRKKIAVLSVALLVIIAVLALGQLVIDGLTKAELPPQQNVLNPEEQLFEILLQVDASNLSNSARTEILVRGIDEFLYWDRSIETPTFKRAVRKLLELDPPDSALEKELGNVLLKLFDSSNPQTPESMIKMLEDARSGSSVAYRDVSFNKRPALYRWSIRATVILERRE